MIGGAGPEEDFELLRDVKFVHPCPVNRQWRILWVLLAHMDPFAFNKRLCAIIQNLQEDFCHHHQQWLIRNFVPSTINFSYLC